MPKELGDGLVCFIVGDTAVATALHVSDLFSDSPTLISESGGSPSEQQSNQLACCVAAKCSGIPVDKSGHCSFGVMSNNHNCQLRILASSTPNAAIVSSVTGVVRSTPFTMW